jgi:hypothetical protein
MECSVSGSTAALYGYSFRLYTAGYADADSISSTFYHQFYYTQRQAHGTGDMSGETLVYASSSTYSAFARTTCGDVEVEEEHTYRVSIAP